MNRTPPPTPRFHVLLAETDDVPWEDDVRAGTAVDALRVALLLRRPKLERLAQILVRRLADEGP